MRRWSAALTIAMLAACSGQGSADSSAVDDGSPTSAVEPGASDDIALPDDDIPVSSAPSTPTETSPASSQEVITLTADGQQNTDPFTLAEGSYSVEFDLRGTCYYAADLTALPSDLGSGLPTTITTAQGPVTGTTNLYDVAAGEYYVGMLTGPIPTCPWSIVLKQR